MTNVAFWNMTPHGSLTTYVSEENIASVVVVRKSAS
jgi:hypothetical protein